MIIYTSPLYSCTVYNSSRYIRVGILRDVTRFLKTDWCALYAAQSMCTRSSLPVRRRGSARLYRAGRVFALHIKTVFGAFLASGSEQLRQFVDTRTQII